MSSHAESFVFLADALGGGGAGRRARQASSSTRKLGRKQDRNGDVLGSDVRARFFRIARARLARPTARSLSTPLDPLRMPPVSGSPRRASLAHFGPRSKTPLGRPGLPKPRPGSFNSPRNERKARAIQTRRRARPAAAAGSRARAPPIKTSNKTK